jgi:hypothetical protein
MLSKPFAPPLDRLAVPRAKALLDDGSTVRKLFAGCLVLETTVPRDGTRGATSWLFGEALPGDGSDTCEARTILRHANNSKQQLTNTCSSNITNPFTNLGRFAIGATVHSKSSVQD